MKFLSLSNADISLSPSAQKAAGNFAAEEPDNFLSQLLCLNLSWKLR